MTAIRPFDPDFGKTGFARQLFRLRFRRLSLSQRAFAARYGLGYSTVRDAEQGARPSAALRLAIAAIENDPEGMANLASKVLKDGNFAIPHARA